MQPKVEPRARRIHGAEIKSQVLAECRQPGASVSAVALAHGLNANLVRKWLQGRGLQRVGLKLDAGPAGPGAAAVRQVPLGDPARLQFVAVQAPTPAAAMGALVAPRPCDAPVHLPEATIAVELRRGDAQLAVRWPAAQAAECALWLRELAAAVLHGRARP